MAQWPWPILFNQSSLTRHLGLHRRWHHLLKLRWTVLDMQFAGKMVCHNDGAHHHHEQSGRAKQQADHSKGISIGHRGSRLFEEIILKIIPETFSRRFDLDQLRRGVFIAG
jgi:hypothetical protein